MAIQVREKLSPAASQTLNVLRGAAALLVLLSHWREVFFVDYPALAHPGVLAKTLYFLCGFGHQSVIIFFVLSGFLVGGSALRQVTADRWSWGRYLFARSTRLYAVLLPALLLGLAWDSSGLHLFGDAGIYGGHGSQNIVQTPVSSTITPNAFLANASFLQGIAGPTFGSNGALWSLAYEFWYYIAFPCLLLAITSRRRAWDRIGYVALSLLVFWTIGPVISYYFLIWMMGAALAALPSCSQKVARMLFAGSALLLLAALAHIRHARSNELVSDPILGIICAALIYAAIISFRGNGSRQVDRIAGHLANSSYTLYLVHTPVLVFISATLAGAQRWTLSPAHLSAAVLVLTLVFLYAQVVYFAFEANTEKLRHAGEALHRWVRAAV